MFHLLDNIIYLFAYFGLFIGTWLLIYPMIKPLFYSRRIRRRFRENSLANQRETNKSKGIKHLEMLLSVTLNNKTPYAIYTFILVSTTLFILTIIFMFNSGNQLFINLLFAFVVAVIPYLILRVKLHNIRINSSYEANALITELNNQYKINFLNMIEAIDHTIPRLNKQPYSKKALTRFSLAIKQYRNSSELEGIIKEFNYSIDTAWSMLLATNLFLSIEYGDDVRESLDDIIEDLKDLKNISEKNKQYNHESFMIIKYIAPATYIFSVLAMFYIFGFNINKFIDYQFNNPMGLKFFILVIFFIAINYLIYFLIRKPKNDF